jgi:general secretion pathway protein F/type IV pilus assembly protein PilC
VNAFYYRVLTVDGRRLAGFVRLAVERDFSARLWLERNRNGVVLSLYRLPSWLSGLFSSNGGFLTTGIRQEDIAGFLRDLGVMTAAGVPMLESLRAIAEEHEYAANPHRSAKRSTATPTSFPKRCATWWPSATRSAPRIAY